MQKILIHFLSIIFLISSDIISFSFSFAISLEIANLLSPNSIQIIFNNNITSLGIYLSLILLSLLWFFIHGHYTTRKAFWDELGQTLSFIFILGLLNFTLIFFTQTKADWIWLAWLAAFILVPIARIITKHILNFINCWKIKTVVIGISENAIEAVEALQSEPLLGYEVIAFLAFCDNNLPETIQVKKQTIPVYCLDLDNPLQSIQKFGKPQIVIAPSDKEDIKNTQYIIEKIGVYYHHINVVPPLKGLPLFGIEASHFFSHEVLFLHVRNTLSRLENRIIKRLFDIVASSILLLLLTPLFAYVIYRIWKEDGFPVIFTQDRVGKDGKLFKFFKFRSMVKDAEAQLKQWKAENNELYQEYTANNFKLKNDPRVLGVGKLIRSSSIDELPQLWNVLIGDMSLVGPRPILEREIKDYGEKISYYKQAIPGISGLWQISGRSHTTFEDRAYYDSWYIKNWSLWYDIVILIRTVKVVLFKEGAY